MNRVLTLVSGTLGCLGVALLLIGALACPEVAWGDDGGPSQVVPCPGPDCSCDKDGNFCCHKCTTPKCDPQNLCACQNTNFNANCNNQNCTCFPTELVCICTSRQEGDSP
jgi:hypothetical protein